MSRRTGASAHTILATPAITGVLLLLFCLSWIVVMISLVQAERMVGLNQFWITRPYEWPKLIAAKGLFLIIWFYLPLAAAQMILLSLGNLPALESVPVLLMNLLLLTAVFVLPVVFAASVTRSIPQAMLALIVMFAVMVVASTISATLARLVPRSLLAVQVSLIAAGLVAAIMSQYRNRTTTRSLKTRRSC